ncbi:hypothetical protein SAMN06265374_0845 [Roseibium denhamense]|uniref:Uncharacterized protein n=1 Tax=Roseibium denhamense TaxID=76305 RepID=A0ABY1NDL9_9HYPH|nr:hypothetical protein SAMN06265374_0845 [Roseibium denhamense]
MLGPIGQAVKVMPVSGAAFRVLDHCCCSRHDSRIGSLEPGDHVSVTLDDVKSKTFRFINELRRPYHARSF